MIKSKLNLIGLDLTKSLQLGGNIEEDKKKELFPFFAYLYSQKLNPEKYGQLQPDEEWSSLISEDEEIINKIVEAYSELGEEDLAALEQQQKEFSSDAEDMQFAAKGAKLKKLNTVKGINKKVLPAKSKGGTSKKKRKCSCGCDMILTKAAGGKVIETCACKCGGKMKKKK